MLNRSPFQSDLATRVGINEDLKVGKELSVEQSYEDLEETFEPGESFSFDATIKLQESS
ncbi:hypothetical protein F2Q68_00027733 [Brassica cretica]|uniref:Uncharacterized protein n=1 Tax=Brassica cretica TaxID=69181 RepID=A0A3N6RNF1_BRACR|nr:hypothetical protein F2Q68_00027733 [Brassica cretica]